MTSTRTAPAGAAGLAAGPAATVWHQRPAAVLGLLALWLLATAGLRPLLLPDEGRYAEVAREMLAGSPWVPLLNGLPFFHKPPLTYWVDMLAMAVLGPIPLAARAGPLLGAWLMGAAVWLALRRQFGPRVAGIGLLALATCPLVYIGGQYANHDMLVAGCIAVAVLSLARALEDDHPPLRWLLAGWAACGLGVLSKGLIGVVLPGLAIVPWLLAQRRWRALLRVFHPAGLLLFAAIALPWHGLMQLRYPGFFDYFIVEQHVRRFATTAFNNRQPLWFYGWVLPLLALPWSLWLPAVWRHWRRPDANARHEDQAARLTTASPAPAGGGSAGGSGSGSGGLYVGLSGGLPGGQPAPGVRRAWAGLMAWWLASVLLFFSLPSSKLVGYILPAAAPLFALLAPALAAGRRWRWAAGAGVAVCVGTVLLLAWKAPNSGRDVGQTLRKLAQPDDLVVMVDDSFDDVSFEARLPRPPLMASDWQDPEIPRRDNWRKEMSDAARFDPATGQAVLLPLKDLPGLVCRGRVVWLVEDARRAQPHAQQVPGAEPVLRGRFVTLWRAQPAACSSPPR